MSRGENTAIGRSDAVAEALGPSLAAILRGTHWVAAVLPVDKSVRLGSPRGSVPYLCGGFASHLTEAWRAAGQRATSTSPRFLLVVAGFEHTRINAFDRLDDSLQTVMTSVLRGQPSHTLNGDGFALACLAVNDQEELARILKVIDDHTVSPEAPPPAPTPPTDLERLQDLLARLQESHEPFRREFSAILSSMGGKNYGSYAVNRVVVMTINRLARLLGVRICDPASGEPATLGCIDVPRSRQGIFTLRRQVSGRQKSVYSDPTLPPLFAHTNTDNSTEK
jgi:hypothetical protein